MSAEPFTAFAFAVELRLPGSDQPLCEAAFCACDGLELRREIIRARDGGDPTTVRLLPGAESVGNVVLRRGMTSSFDLWDWWERVRRGLAGRATCDIVVLSPDLTQERVRFRLYRCLPVKMTGPALNATGNDIAIESLELACEGIDIVRPGDKPPDAAVAEPVAKAQLRELDASFEREINKQRWVTVQINPHELRTSFSHELGPTTRLDLRLTFAVDAPAPRGRRAPDDVRRLTERVAYFATPRASRGGAATRPAVRLAWGTFQFDGHVEALEETLEAFSPDGRPLRATLALALARAQIAPYAFATAGGGGRG
ncbi:MAG TPA: phage tail protein [Solirubrobacteraceae bacterium]|nr:phage tail protein [Solirubrobacteraceae bacterium]